MSPLLLASSGFSHMFTISTETLGSTAVTASAVFSLNWCTKMHVGLWLVLSHLLQAALSAKVTIENSLFVPVNFMRVTKLLTRVFRLVEGSYWSNVDILVLTYSG